MVFVTVKLPATVDLQRMVRRLGDTCLRIVCGQELAVDIRKLLIATARRWQRCAGTRARRVAGRGRRPGADPAPAHSDQDRRPRASARSFHRHRRGDGHHQRRASGARTFDGGVTDVRATPGQRALLRRRRRRPSQQVHRRRLPPPTHLTMAPGDTQSHVLASAVLDGPPFGRSNRRSAFIVGVGGSILDRRQSGRRASIPATFDVTANYQ